MKIFFFLVSLVSIHAQTYSPGVPDFLEGEILAPFDPPVWQDPEMEGGRPGQDEVTLTTLFEIARIVFSYMVYGGSLTYVPSDLARGVGEEVRAIPAHEIRWGDTALTQHHRWIDEENGQLVSGFRYTLSASQKRNLELWLSGSLSGAGATGTARWAYKAGVYRESMEQAFKESLRAWLRLRHYNKPREINVTFRLRSVPVFRIEAGVLHTRVNILMTTPDVRDYKEF